MFDLKIFLSNKGRINRQTWWISVIVVNIILFISYTFLQAIVDISNDGLFEFVLLLIIFIVFALSFGANITVNVKRLHDTDRSGWWLLVGLIPYIGTLILLYVLGFQKGMDGVNLYGAPMVIEKIGHSSASDKLVEGTIERANSLAKMDQLDRAIHELQEVHSLAPDRVADLLSRLFYKRGMGKEKTGFWIAALDDYKNAMRLTTDYELKRVTSEAINRASQENQGRLPSNLLCPQCGREINVDWIKCPYCGYRFEHPAIKAQVIPSPQIPSNVEIRNNLTGQSQNRRRTFGIVLGLVILTGLFWWYTATKDNRLYHEAEEYAVQGNYASAINSYERLINDHPGSEFTKAASSALPDLYSAWGDDLSTSDNYEEAIEKFEYLVENYGNHPAARDANKKIAKLYVAMGDAGWKNAVSSQDDIRNILVDSFAAYKSALKYDKTLSEAKSKSEALKNLPEGTIYSLESGHNRLVSITNDLNRDLVVNSIISDMVFDDPVIESGELGVTLESVQGMYSYDVQNFSQKTYTSVEYGVKIRSGSSVHSNFHHVKIVINLYEQSTLQLSFSSSGTFIEGDIIEFSVWTP